jgi:hypothetical protein
MSTSHQLIYSALHGTAMRYAAERRNLDEAIEELRRIAAGDRSIKYFETGQNLSCGTRHKGISEPRIPQALLVCGYSRFQPG